MTHRQIPSVILIAFAAATLVLAVRNHPASTEPSSGYPLRLVTDDPLLQFKQQYEAEVQLVAAKHGISPDVAKSILEDYQRHHEELSPQINDVLPPVAPDASKDGKDAPKPAADVPAPTPETVTQTLERLSQQNHLSTPDVASLVYDFLLLETSNDLSGRLNDSPEK